MKEREFQGWVLDVAARFGWRAWHVSMPVQPIGGGKFVPDPRGKGLPDLILLHADPARLVFAELKGSSGTLEPEQREFLELASNLAAAYRDHTEAVRHVIESELGVTFPGEWQVPLGVYVWRPGMEEQIETVLRSKVLS